jgi:DNA (cytosine-5)-methyltransferase 1
MYSGVDEGDVTKIDWKQYKDKIDVVHGGPPCQPFSIAGEQEGLKDDRNMWGEFSRAINIISPKVFVAENVLGLMTPKFEGFVKKYIINKLNNYSIIKFEMHAADYGVPQIRRRVFFVGFKNVENFNKFSIPKATHSWQNFNNRAKMTSLSLFDCNLPKTLGVRASLGLPNINYDNLSPTIRSGFTGKRNTTSILNSSAGQKSWGDMEIWPNGVQANRKKASAFPAKNKHFRLSVQDVALIQGFPKSWQFTGAVYQILGQIGNSVSPPVAYHVAKQVSIVLSS